MFLKEIYRILKPGGYIVLSTNNLAAAHWIVMFILGIQPPTATVSDEMQVKDFNNVPGERLHHRLFTLRGLERVFRYFGFKVEKSIGTYYPPFPLWVSRVLCKIDKYHASCITIKARKPITKEIPF
jgi:ubiquinone/menaquinone biosynthesis C-methylase UbiE